MSNLIVLTYRELVGKLQHSRDHAGDFTVLYVWGTYRGEEGSRIVIMQAGVTIHVTCRGNDRATQNADILAEVFPAYSNKILQAFALGRDCKITVSNGQYAFTSLPKSS